MADPTHDSNENLTLIQDRLLINERLEAVFDCKDEDYGGPLGITSLRIIAATNPGGPLYTIWHSVPYRLILGVFLEEPISGGFGLSILIHRSRPESGVDSLSFRGLSDSRTRRAHDMILTHLMHL